MTIFAIRQYADRGKHTPNEKPRVLKPKHQKREKALDYVRERNLMQRIAGTGKTFILVEVEI